MRKVIVAAIAAGFSLVAPGYASAQGLGLYVGPPPAYDYYDGYYYDVDPPVYGYSSRVERDRSYYRAPAGRCGVYRFWNGDRCVDARNYR
jgi:hypothetical protein